MYYSPITNLYWYFSAAFRCRAAIIAALLCAGAAAAIFLYKTGRIVKRTAVCGFALWLYLLFVLFVTVIGRCPSDTYTVRTTPFAAYRDYLVTDNPDVLRDIVINLLLFVPFAFLCAKFIDCISKDRDNTVRTIAITMACGVILTLTVELLQLTLSAGTFDVDDLIHNTIGTMLGITLWLLWDQLVMKESGRQK